MRTTAIKLDHAGLWDLVQSWNGTRIVTLVTITVPAMNKTDNPFHGLVEKVVRRNGVCGAKYSSVVNRRRAKEGQPVDGRGDVLPFDSDQLPWGRHASRYFVAHTPIDWTEERFYLKFLPKSDLIEQYRFKRTKHEVPEAAIPYLRSFLRQRREGSRRQGLLKPVAWKTIAMESLDQLHIDGQVYLIRHTPAKVQAA